jgi:hypothetical protein
MGTSTEVMRVKGKTLMIAHLRLDYDWLRASNLPKARAENLILCRKQRDEGKGQPLTQPSQGVGERSALAVKCGY